MKKLAGLFAIFGLILFICIGLTPLSNAQKLKPGVKDIKKPGVSKSVVKKPGLSKSIKSQLPALEVSRLTLDSGCKVTGYLQNNGSKMDARHPDFSKLEIKVGYTLNGKTKEVLLKTRQASNKSQPLLLVGTATLRNFVQGRPVKFTSKLKVPSTGKGFATVFAVVDPANKIRETSKGERKKRIQARLRSRCASRGPGSVKVNPPKRIKKSINSPTSRIVKPPSGVKPGKRSKKLGKSSIKIDPGTKKEVKVSANSKFNNENMVTKNLISEDFVFGGSGRRGGGFSIWAPKPGSRVHRYNPPDITWKVPPQFLNADGSLKVMFLVGFRNWAAYTDLRTDVEAGVEGGDGKPLGVLDYEIHSIVTPYSYERRSKICRITSWEIDSRIEDGDYFLTILAIEGTGAEMAFVGAARMPRPFEIYTGGLTGSDSEPEPEEILDPISENPLHENTTETVQGMMDPTVTIIAPNGNEEWGLNTPHEIVWKTFARDPERNFRVTLEKHTERGVSDVRSISTDRSLDYDRATGTYKFLWFVDSDIDPAAFYRIRVSEIDGTLEDESNEYFSIRPEEPGDERFLVNVTYPVNSSSGSSNVHYRRIRVNWKGSYDVCNKRNLNIVLHSVTTGVEYPLRFNPYQARVTDGSVVFDIPEDIAQGDECYVRVNTIPNACFGHSDQFTIRGSIEERNSMYVLNPGPLDRYYLGNRIKIVWRDGMSRGSIPTDPIPSNREITLLTGDSNRVVHTIPVSDINLNEDGSSFYTFWDIPLSLPEGGRYSGYKIKIRALDTGDQVITQAFQIINRGIDITAPMEGNTYYTGSILPIQWASVEGAEGDLKIVLVPHTHLTASINDSNGIIIASDLDVGAGQFNSWRIPLNTAPREYKLLVGYDLNRSDGVDVVYESSVFTISKPSLKFSSAMMGSASRTPRFLADNNMIIEWAYEGDTLGQEVTISLIFTDLSEKRIATLPVASGGYTWQIGRTIANMHDVATPRGGRTPDPHTGNFFQLHIYLNGDEGVEDITRHFIIVPDGE